jgi:poly(beta-D-mannuronate) lyase
VDPGPAPAPAPAPTPTRPSGLLDLRGWKLTLPIETPHDGHPDEILQPELATFVLEPYFHLNAKKDGVVFRAPVEGATTSGSGYPRSELREMTADGKRLASWSTTSGKHTMVIRQAITHVPAVKDEVVAGQIHDGSSDLIEIRLEGKHLFVAADGPNVGTLDSNYTLGTVFTVKIEATGGHVKVSYNDVLKVDIARATGSCYFKAGMYPQSNLSKGDAPGAYGEAIIYDVKVTHE